MTESNTGGDAKSLATIKRIAQLQRISRIKAQYIDLDVTEKLRTIARKGKV